MYPVEVAKNTFPAAYAGVASVNPGPCASEVFHNGSPVAASNAHAYSSTSITNAFPFATIGVTSMPCVAL